MQLPQRFRFAGKHRALRSARNAATRLAVCVCLSASSALAQTAPDKAMLAFDIASVRPSKPGAAQHTNVPLDSGNVYGAISSDAARTAAGGYFIATHQALWRYISFAYKLSGTQELALRFNMFSGAPKSGAPFWATGSFDSSPEFFDISARAPADTSIDQMRLMMQALLADRFHFMAHEVSADAPVFALVLAKQGVLGPHLQPHPSSDSCAAAVHENSTSPSGPTSTSGVTGASIPATQPAAVGDLPPACGVVAHVPSATPGLHYGGRAVPLALLATSVPTMTGLAVMPRPVVDQTGLTGLYDFTLTWAHDISGQGDAVDDNAANFREAVKKQLGLELKSSHAPISFLIIDHVERPTEN